MWRRSQQTTFGLQRVLFVVDVDVTPTRCETVVVADPPVDSTLPSLAGESRLSVSYIWRGILHDGLEMALKLDAIALLLRINYPMFLYKETKKCAVCSGVGLCSVEGYDMLGILSLQHNGYILKGGQIVTTFWPSWLHFLAAQTTQSRLVVRPSPRG